MAEETDILEPEVDEQQPDNGPVPQPPAKTPPQQPVLKDEDKQQLVKIITKMQQAGEPEDNIRAVVKRFQETRLATPATPVDKGIRQTTQNLSQPLQFNGTFQPDLEGEKKGLYLNDPDYQAQRKDFVGRIATDENGYKLYPEVHADGKLYNYYTQKELKNFDPHSLEGKIIEVPNTKAALDANNGKRFITPKYNWNTNSYDYPGVQTPDVPTQQTLPTATVYGSKTIPSKAGDAIQPQPIKDILAESDKQGGEFRSVLKNHTELSTDVVNTLNKLGDPYKASIKAGSQGMMNVLQKTVEDKYNLNRPLPANVDPNILNGHLNVLNNFDKNRNEFESQQQELQHQADLLADRAKRTGQPVNPEDADRLAQKAANNLQRWNAYTKAVNFAQNYVNQPEVKQYLSEFQKRQQGIGLMDEIRQRSFPKDTEAQIKQDEYDRKAIEGNTNVWDYLKTAGGAAGKGLANVAEGAAELAPSVLPAAFTNSKLYQQGIAPSYNAFLQKLNNNAQQFLSSNAPAISPEAVEQISKGKGGLSLLANDFAYTVGGFAPYILPGLAEEAGAAKAATFGMALSESLPTVRKEAESAGLTGSAYNTYLTAKPLVNAAFMTLLPNIKFAKGFENDVAKAVVEGEFNNPKKALLNMAAKAVKDPSDVAHLQAMLTGTNLGNAVVNQVTNGLQAKEDLQRGLSRKQGLSTDISGAFDPRQTAVMALAGKVLESVPTLKNALGDYRAGKDISETYNHIQSNLVELAATNNKAVSAKVDELLKKDPGNIYTQHLKNTLEDFAHAELRMPQGLEPEQKAALFSVQKEISQKQRQMAYADPVYQPHLQKNIDELTKQIPEILKDPKKANDYLKDSHKDFVENISSPKTDTDGKKTSNAPQTEGRQEIEKPSEGAATTLAGTETAPSIETNPAYRTLDYGDNKGKDENKEAQEKIKQEILSDEPIGKTGERFSQLLGRVIPEFKKSLDNDPHNTAIVTHSSVIKAIHVWEEIGRPDISEIKGDKLKEFAQKYVDMKPEAEGKVHTFTGDNGNAIKVVRHGETEDNKLSEFREDDTQLTDKGQAQAAKAGENLIKETGGNIPKMISSDMPRTLHTSEIINDQISKHSFVQKRSNKVKTSDAPTMSEVSHSLDEKGTPGYNIEIGKTSAGTPEIPREQAPIKGYKYVTFRDNEGKIKGSLQISYHDYETGKIGDKPQNLKIFVDEAERGKGIGEKLLATAEKNGIDLSHIKSEHMTDAGAALVHRYLKNKQNAVSEQAAGKMGVRNEPTVRGGMGGQDRPEQPAGQGEQPITEEKGKDEGQKVPGEPDKTDELPFIEEEGDNEVTSTRNAVAKQKIEEAGLKEPMKEAAREFGTVWKDAQQKIAKGFDVEKLIKSLDNKPRAVTDLENAMILFHQNVKESQLDAANKDIAEAIDKKKPDELADAVERRAKLLDDLQSIYNVDKKIGRETARGLNARKMMADLRFSLVNMQMEKRAAKLGEPLSDAEMKELQKQHDEIKEAKEAVDARVAELEKENARLKAEKTVSGGKGWARTKKTKDQFKDERKDIVQKMRADLLKAAKGGEGLTSSVPFAAQLKAVAPHIKDLVKSFIEEGVDKLDDITKNIMAILKPEIPDIEERHIHDLIAGVYNEPAAPKEPTKYQEIKEQAQVQKYRATDPKLMKAQADYERAKDKFTQSLKVDERKNRTGFEKVQDVFLKYERAAKLSNPITLGKLVMAALTRLGTTPLESGVGAVYSKIFPGLAKKAPGEAGANVAALAKGYKAAFMRGLDDAATVAKGGKTDIEAIYGKKGQLPPEALDFFGQLHSAIKAPVKRFAFERSFQKRMANNIKNGTPIDGMVEARIAMEAYKDAERSIFMQDNPISKGWTNAMAAMERSGSSGELAATIGRWLLPFVKVPTNILGETITHVAGPEIALTQIISKSLGKGLNNLSQDEAESIMRNLKKGTIGHVALMAGYLNPQVFGGYYQKGEKRDDKDVKVGDMRVLGINIPAWALEAPIFQAMQVGATVRRIKDTMVKGQEKGIGEGVWGGALGLMSHEPLLDEPSRIMGAFSSDKERGYFFGELAKSTLVPAIADYAAKVSDPADTRSVGEKMLEPENKRSPETVGEHIESGIPGLRENTPIKKPKVTGHRQRQHR